MKKPIVYYSVAKGGYLKGIEIERFEITSEEIEEIMEGDSNLTKEDAIQEILSDIDAEYGQHWANVLFFTEKEFKSLFKDDVKIKSK